MEDYRRNNSSFTPCFRVDCETTSSMPSEVFLTQSDVTIPQIDSIERKVRFERWKIFSADSIFAMSFHLQRTNHEKVDSNRNFTPPQELYFVCLRYIVSHSFLVVLLQLILKCHNLMHCYGQNYLARN